MLRCILCVKLCDIRLLINDVWKGIKYIYMYFDIFFIIWEYLFIFKVIRWVVDK